jgi:hypothetical protein
MPTWVSAQDLPVGKWWRTPSIVEQLHLNEKQLSHLDDLFVESTRKLMDLKNEVEKEQFELKVRLESKALDEDGIMEQVRKLEKKRALLNEERVRIIVKTRQIIGYDAFIRLKELIEKRAKENASHSANKPEFKSNHGFSNHLPIGRGEQ